MSKEVAEEYLSSLADLTVNSKPLINMLTMLADENVDHAPAIVQVIENHIQNVAPEIKLPILYLIDSIIKNVSQMYVPLFTQNIVNIFVSVFQKVDEKIRLNMYKLRQTWGDVFPAKKLYELDLKVKDIDNAWPVTAPTPAIHFNPKFLGSKTNISEVSTSVPVTTLPNNNVAPQVPAITTTPSDISENVLRDQLRKKQEILMQLHQKKLELELMQTKAKLEEQHDQQEQQKHINDTGVVAGLVRPPITDEAVKVLSQRGANKPKAVMSPSSVLNSKSKKTKIAPANTQIIEAVKSRDPRIAKQHILQSKTSEITTKEQEIYNRQLAMLKTPVIEQVVPVAPVQRVLSESSVKGHITINIERNRDRDKSAKTKKQVKDRSKKETSPSKSKYKEQTSEDSRSSRSRNSKSSASHSKNSNGSGRSSSRGDSATETVKAPSKNERSPSPGNSRHSTNEVPARNSNLCSNSSLEPPPPPIISRTDDESNHGKIEEINYHQESLVNASEMDVDFRQLSAGGASPSKKKLPTDSILDQPPRKKSKIEAFDELFGNEDVDLRKMTAPNLNPGERLPSPPPPPVISNGPPVPQVAAVAPMVVVDNAKVYGSDGEEELGNRNGENEKNRKSYDSVRSRHRRTWADVKIKPEAEVKPVSLSAQLELEMDQRKDSFSQSFDSSEKGNKKNFRERMSHGGELDRLGRPLLYNKLPNDPRARRESLGVLDGRDTDMRRFGGLMERDMETNVNVNMIVGQAEDQVRNGTMSMKEYNELIKQVIYVNEKQKLREAQTKGRQESRRSHQRSRRSPNRYGSRCRDGQNYRLEEDRRDRRHFNDIDERLHMPWRSLSRNENSGMYNRLAFASGSTRSPFDLSTLEHRNYLDRSIKPDIWEEEKRFRQLSVVEEAETNLSRTRDVVNIERTHDCVDIPPADPQVLELIAKDPMKSINIDGTARDIRFYGDTAVVMLSWDDPKEISFEDGIRRVAIGDMNIVCALNESYGIFMINGKPHRIRLGAPTRELYIDGEFYEPHFGGPPIPVQIDGLQYLVQVEGPPPQVKIGKQRLDLICGRVNMIVDASAILPLYLDSKPQRFDIRSRPYVFRFVNSLKTLLINEVPVDIQFGGMCRQICGYGNLHFLRLSMLPNGIVPGCVQIINMENIGLPVGNTLEGRLSDTNSPPLSSLPLNINQGTSVNNAVTDISQTNVTKLHEGSLDMLTSLMNGVSGAEQSVGFNYQIENKELQPVQTCVNQVSDVPTTEAQQPQASGIPFLGGTLNINDLFQRLVASGIVQTTVNMNANTTETMEDSSPFDTINFSSVNTLKEKYPSVITTLYSGIQCSSCGVRFSPEETVKYSRHLDWHFRQNRREKDAARKMRSRKWYYDVSDWIQFEEIEDLEERAQSWFDTETAGVTEEQEQEDIKSVPAPQGQDITRCEMCRDQFDTYYNEEKEEWHLKPCIIVEDKYYHPLCYEDLMSMPEDSLLANKTTDSFISVKDDDTFQSKARKIIDVDKEVEDDQQQNNDDYVSNVEEENRISDELRTVSDYHKRISPDQILEHFVETKFLENSEVKGGEDMVIESDEERESVIRLLLSELINCITYKEDMQMEEDIAEVQEESEPEKEEEIEVLENVPVAQKKNIIAVDLIEKLDDDEEEVVYKRKTPSPITFIPTIKIKQEPIDEMESPVAVVDQTYTNVVSSIDGNVEMIDTPPIAPAGPSKIKINFNKPISTDHNASSVQKVIIKELNDISPEEVDPEPLPPRPKKPRIAENEMTEYLPCVKGTEVSGLCTIM